MDSPILPDRSDNEEQGGGRVPARYLPPPYALRVVAGVITVVTAIIGLVWQLQSHPHRAALVATIALPAISHVTYGDPNVAALRPATSLALGARRVCTDEIRPKPRSGVWRCNVWDDLSFDAIGAQAIYRGDPCTHRTTIGYTQWKCLTTTAIPKVTLHLLHDKLPYFFGDFMQGNGIDQKKVPGVCWIEFRASQHAQWLCGSVNSWRPLLPSLHAIKAADPGGPCVYREVDETTGVWQCLQRH